MSPSKAVLTAGQIGKIQDLLAAGLRKAGLLSEPAQVVLEHQTKVLVGELVDVVRFLVKITSEMVVRELGKVDRTRTPQEVLKATGCKQDVYDGVVKSMPSGVGDGPEEVFFFKPDFSAKGMNVFDRDLDEAYSLRGLVPADPYSLAEINRADPTLVSTHPNITFWRDAEGHLCYCRFAVRNDGARGVRSYRYDDDLADGWWLAGVRINKKK